MWCKTQEWGVIKIKLEEWSKLLRLRQLCRMIIIMVIKSVKEGNQGVSEFLITSNMSLVSLTLTLCRCQCIKCT